MITTVAEIATPDSNFFLRSEYVLASDWPVLAFTKPGEAGQIRRLYRPGLDFIFWVGTSKAPTDLQLRARLLSLVRIDTKNEVVTRDVVTEEAWRKKLERGAPGQWLHSFRAVEVWDIQGDYPVKSFAPKAYELRRRERGTILSLVGAAERRGLMTIKIRPMEVRPKSAIAP
jgi:hypothetical protein